MVNSKNYKDICNYSDFKYIIIIIIIKGNICCKNRFFAKSWTAKINFFKKTYYIFKVTVVANILVVFSVYHF